MKLKEFRIKAGLTQVDLAEKVGVRQSTIAMLEAGKNKLPRMETLLKICDALNCTVDELVGRKKN